MKVAHTQCASFLPHDPALRTLATAEAKCRKTAGCSAVSDLYCNGIHATLADHYALCRGHRFRTSPDGTCVFKRNNGKCAIHAHHSDLGYTDTYRGWYDLQGCGKCYNYCRWVGNSGPGGDPSIATTYLRKGATSKSFWSCVSTKTGYNTHSSFAFKKCSDKGAPAPPLSSSAQGIQYLGCFKNEAGDRVNGHVPEKNFVECSDLAAEAGVATFGMEYPQGAKVAGEGGSVLHVNRTASRSRSR
jgi:hypothetical protein